MSCTDPVKHNHYRKLRGQFRALEECYYTKHGRRYHNRGTASSSGTRSQTKISIIKTIVHNLNLEYVTPQRAGIIIYTVVNGAIYFGLGLDAKTHDLTDFGGGVSYKTDLNVIRGAIREFEEETLEIFDPITADDLKQCPVIYDKNNLIIFVHIDIDPDTISNTFNSKYQQIIDMNRGKRKVRDPEVCGITWLTWEEFQKSINEKGIMFSRVQRLLSRAGDFSYLL